MSSVCACSSLAVVEQLVQRRLVRDDGVHQLRVGLRQGQRADRAAAGAEDRGRAGVEVGEQPGEVVGAHAPGWSPGRGRRRGLRLMPRGSVVSTVWSAASRSASGANDRASIGAPTSTTSGPAPRTS